MIHYNVNIRVDIFLVNVKEKVQALTVILWLEEVFIAKEFQILSLDEMKVNISNEGIMIPDRDEVLQAYLLWVLPNTNSWQKTMLDVLELIKLHEQLR